MGDYSLLFGLEVIHPYFSDPARLRLRFEPDEASAAWLTKAGCVTRVWSHRIEVHHETKRDLPRRLADMGQADDLRFAVHALDPRFAQYTHDQTQMHEPPLTFWGGDASRRDADWRMHPGTDHAHFWTAPTPRPDLVAVIPVAGEPAAEPRRYSLALRSRATIWKYLLLGPWDDVEPYIEDPDRAFAFAAAPDEALADGRIAKVLCSQKPIPLSERFAQKFELRAREPGDGPGRSLIKRLPVPHPASLAGRRSDSTLVSEIYVQPTLKPLAP